MGLLFFAFPHHQLLHSAALSFFYFSDPTFLLTVLQAITACTLTSKASSDPFLFSFVTQPPPVQNEWDFHHLCSASVLKTASFWIKVRLPSPTFKSLINSPHPPYPTLSLEMAKCILHFSLSIFISHINCAHFSPHSDVYFMLLIQIPRSFWTIKFTLPSKLYIKSTTVGVGGEGARRDQLSRQVWVRVLSLLWWALWPETSCLAS